MQELIVSLFLINIVKCIENFFGSDKGLKILFFNYELHEESL